MTKLLLVCDVITADLLLRYRYDMTNVKHLYVL